MNKKKWKFVALTKGFKPLEADDFEGAWRHMYSWVKKQMATGKLSYQVLETAIWLERPDGIFPIMFPVARDRACKEGIMDKIKAEEASSKKG